MHCGVENQAPLSVSWAPDVCTREVRKSVGEIENRRSSGYGYARGRPLPGRPSLHCLSGDAERKCHL